MNEEQKPYIEIDGVQLNVDDLPEEGQAIFGRLQRLNQKKANMTLDLEEIQASINFFSSRIVQLVNNDNEGVEVPSGEVALPEVDIEETDAFPPEED
tara:strand:- start:3045 stop:3335 length:291 start_codon:yes stop_codon:yes gene_type:complete